MREAELEKDISERFLKTNKLLIAQLIPITQTYSQVQRDVSSTAN